jgi:hypothetical protein
LGEFLELSKNFGNVVAVTTVPNPAFHWMVVASAGFSSKISLPDRSCGVEFWLKKIVYNGDYRNTQKLPNLIAAF